MLLDKLCKNYLKIVNYQPQLGVYLIFLYQILIIYYSL